MSGALGRGSSASAPRKAVSSGRRTCIAAQNRMSCGDSRAGDAVPGVSVRRCLEPLRPSRSCSRSRRRRARPRRRVARCKSSSLDHAIRLSKQQRSISPLMQTHRAPRHISADCHSAPKVGLDAGLSTRAQDGSTQSKGRHSRAPTPLVNTGSRTVPRLRSVIALTSGRALGSL
jgi:hypothetical protein